MLTRRDIATFAWYGVLFSAVVCWAALRHGSGDAASHDDLRTGRQIEPMGSNENAQLRRAVSHMVTQ